ncbi:hypothetical protein [Paenibacillus macerans]|uniref:hypothetical protein n=1 Tax=Paenibacillus macerans TaxID=44252 RepID=UPI0022E319D2|nr:hypothetical protein [Paenibacillus macerans]
MRLKRLLFSCLVVLLFLGSLGPTSLLAEGRPEKTTNFTKTAFNSVQGDVTPELPSDKKAVTNSVYSVTNSVYNLLAAEKTELLINPGESVRFTNDTSVAINIIPDAAHTNDIRYDFVTYYASGKVFTDDMAFTGVVTGVPSKGGTAVITADYGLPLTVRFDPRLSYTYISTPALLKKTLHRGESYLFSNQADKSSRSFLSDAKSSNEKRYDYAVYKENNSLRVSSLDSENKFSIGLSESVIFTGASNEPVTVAVPYEEFIGYETDEPAYDSVLLYPGESYKFTNVGTKSERIEDTGTTKDKFDYVVYNEEGTETSRGTNTPNLPLVAAGSYVVITLITDNPVRIGGPYRAFMGGAREDDAITRITLSPGESYRFTNNGTLTNPVKNNAREVEGLYDYTVYKADGSYFSDGFDSISTPRLPAGGFAIITVQGTADVTFDYTDDFSAEPSGEPSHFRVTLLQGESYEFKNNTSSLRVLRSNATTNNRFDWVEYFPDGTQQYKRANTYKNPAVDGGNSVIVTAVSAPVTFGASYRLFSWKDKPGEAISKQVIHLGESYTFSNTGSKQIAINSDAKEIGGQYDVAIYREDGSINRSTFEDSGTVYVPAGGYAVITGQSDSPVTISYTDTISVVPAEHPAFLRATVTSGDSYTYINISDEVERLYSRASNSNKFTYVIRRPDGTVEKNDQSNSGLVMVPAGYSITVTPITDSVTFGGVYTSFRGMPGENPMYKQVIRLSKSFRFSNTGSEPITLTSDAIEANGKYDVAVYSDDGSVYSAAYEETGNVKIPVGGYAILTGQSADPVTISYLYSIDVTSTIYPALLRATLQKGATFTFTNISDEAEYLYNNAVSGAKEFAYVLYRPDGTVYSERDNHSTPVQIPAGYAITLTSKTAAVTFGGVYTSFTGAEGENPMAKKVTLAQNESYLFTNVLDSTQTLSSNATPGLSMFDYAIYGPDGKPEKAEFDQDGNLSVPAGSQVVVTATTANPVTFTYGQAFEASPSTEPALLKKTLETNQSIGFKNKSAFEAKLTTNASTSSGRYFDYTIFDSSGAVVRQGKQTATSYGVPAGGKIQVKTTSANPVVYAAPYRIFEFTEAEEHIFEELQHRQLLDVKKATGENGYYRFVAPEAGRYRFVTFEKNNFAQQPVLTLYDRPDLLEPIGSSEQVAQEFGIDYTVLETDLTSGQIVYLKLSEKNGLPLELQLIVSMMTIAPETKLQYTPDGKLLQMTFPTGDKLIYEYDSNGNLMRRVKKVYPF